MSNLSPNQIREKLIPLVADILEIDPVDLTAHARFREISGEWDSLQGFAMLCMIEDDFGVALSVEEFLEMDTIEHLAERLSRG